MRSNKNKKLKNWLMQKNATSTEAKIYDIALRVEKKKQFPFSNGDILAILGTSRTNVRQHIQRMISKGLLERYSYHTYSVVTPFRKRP